MAVRRLSAGKRMAFSGPSLFRHSRGGPRTKKKRNNRGKKSHGASFRPAGNGKHSRASGRIFFFFHVRVCFPGVPARGGKQPGSFAPCDSGSQKPLGIHLLHTPTGALFTAASEKGGGRPNRLFSFGGAKNGAPYHGPLFKKGGGGRGYFFGGGGGGPGPQRGGGRRGGGANIAVFRKTHPEKMWPRYRSPSTEALAPAFSPGPLKLSGKTKFFSGAGPAGPCFSPIGGGFGGPRQGRGGPPKLRR